VPVLLLGEVDEAGEGEDGDGHQDDQQAQLLVGLPQSEEQALESSEVSDLGSVL
jgi:hypothetical protein